MGKASLKAGCEIWNTKPEGGVRRKEWGVEARPPTVSGGRSNKLKEEQTEEEGIRATRGGLGAGLEDSQHL